MKNKKSLCLLLTLVLCVLMMPAAGFAAETSDVKYLDADGVEQICTSAVVVESSTSAVTWGTANQETWYVVDGGTSTAPLTISGVTVQGNVHLILKDGCNLTVTGGTGKAGISVSGTNSLTIYSQSTGEKMGTLNIKGGSYGAGIGGGGYRGSGGHITINGGTVTATGGYGSAGIGGAYGGSGSYITINDGIVTATGGDDGAGIGGGNSGFGSQITINDGTVTATGGYGSAGIGGGHYGFCSHITINDGKVTATGGNFGAGIGSGDYGSGSYITINGGTVTATGGVCGAGIGNGDSFSTGSSNIKETAALLVRAGNSTEWMKEIPHTADTDLAGIEDFNGKRYVRVAALGAVAYRYPVYNKTDGDFYANASSGIEEWRDDGYCSTYTDIFTGSTSAVTWGKTGEDTWYVVSGGTEDSPLTIAGVTVLGNVHLILEDGCNLTVTGGAGKAGICVSGTNSLTIYSQSTGETMGKLSAQGGAKGAGIGGDYYDIVNNGTGNDGTGNNITINGGNVTATGGGGGAGIGGGYNGSGSNITINDGNVTATGGSITDIGGTDGDSGGAGIGGGDNEKGNNITINGGNVTATGGKEGAGIGGGRNGFGSNITINDGDVTATGGDNGAGIGGGLLYAGKNITINGGNVTAKGGQHGAGIGGGNNNIGSDITIKGGTVTATGGGGSAGIGGGYNSSGSNIIAATALMVKADGNNPPTTVINNTGGDLASALSGKQYVQMAIPSISVGEQSGVLTYGTAGSAVYTVEAKEFTPSNGYKVEWKDSNDQWSEDLPEGVDTKFNTENTELTVSTTAAAGAGTYTFRLKYDNVISPEAMLAVLRKTLTVTPDADQSKVYGTNDPVLTYTSTDAATGETAAFDGALGRAEGEDVSEYTINIGTLALKDNDTFKQENYFLKLNETAVNFKITQATVNITKADAAVETKPTANALTYNGSDQKLVTAGTGSGGTMKYVLGTDSTSAPGAGANWSTTIPTGKDTGTYYVWYKVVGDGNHNDTDAVCVTVSIGQKAVTDTTADSPDTGLMGNAMILPIIIGLIVLAVVLAFVVIKRRKRN